VLLAFAVNKPFGVNLFHERRKDSDVVLSQTFKETIPRLPTAELAMHRRRSRQTYRRSSTANSEILGDNRLEDLRLRRPQFLHHFIFRELIAQALASARKCQSQIGLLLWHSRPLSFLSE
jgi:hypothetical protein